MYDRRRLHEKRRGHISAGWGALVALVTLWLWLQQRADVDNDDKLEEVRTRLQRVKHDMDDVQNEIEALKHIRHVEEKKDGHREEEKEEQNESEKGSEGEAGSGDGDAEYAYVTVVSVESYVDGALVMGESLKKISPMIQDGSCQLVCVASRPGVSDDSADRLRKVGWNVVQVEGLAKHVPKAHWADSFDKLYIFRLTQFKTIVFVDADMMALKSPDALFTTVKLHNESYIGAIGSNPKHHKGPYFQTGMLVLHPSKKVSNDLFKLFRSESLPNKKKGIYNALNARDGMMLRSYFGVRYTTISNTYSKHLAPWEDMSEVKMVHFRGGFKPWYSIESIASKKVDELSFGNAYRMWWGYYDKIHQEQAPSETWEDSNPSKYYWMLRHTDNTYFKKQLSKEAADRNMTRPGLSLIKGKRGKSCDDVCKTTDTQWCDEEALIFLHLSDCSLLKTVFSCSSCEFAEHRKDYPGVEAPCFIPEQDLCLKNFNMDPRMKAACSDSHEDVSRLCPCATSDNLKEKAVRWTGQSNSMQINP